MTGLGSYSIDSRRTGLQLRIFVVALGLLAYALAGCSEGPGGEHLTNQPPTVWLSSAPPSGTDTFYKIHMYWGGWDPDGDIAYYEYTITDNDNGIFDPADTASTPGHNPWHRVSGNDSVFTFTADVIVDSNTVDQVTRFERSHTFLIRSVDQEGLASVDAAHRSFTAWTFSPSVVITNPRQVGLTATIVSPVSTFQWKAQDYVQDLFEPQEAESVRWILKAVEGGDFEGTFDYIRHNPHAPEWYPWHYYKAPGDSGRSWTTEPIDLGNYGFAVQAKDEAGAVTPVFDEKLNMRRVHVSRRTTGPQLDVSTEYMGTIRSATTTAPTVIVDMPANVNIQFTWSADADSYGGTVTGYRYGWDINDLGDKNQWEVDWTPFVGRTNQATSTPRKFYFGSHIFDVEVIDNTNTKSRVEVKVNIIPFTMSRPLLLVDDYNPNSPGIAETRGAAPSDLEHDAFWADMLENVAGFRFEDDQLQVKQGRLMSIVDIADYKSIIWDAAGGYNVNVHALPKLYDLIQYRPKGWSWNASSGKIEPNLLRLFLRAGGHLMLCGYQPLSQGVKLANLKYPVIVKYELGGDQDGNYIDQIYSGNAVGDEAFVYLDCCATVVDEAFFQTFGQMRSQGSGGCPVNTLRNNDPRTDGLREALPIEPRFPKLELRREVAQVGRAYAENTSGFPAEIYNPPYFAFCSPAELNFPLPCFEPIYGLGCLNTDSPTYGAPVAFWSSSYANIVPDVLNGVPARSVYFGFEPYYFKPNEVKEMLDIILFDEWQLIKL